MARHNQFRARNQHLNLTDLWDQACMGLRGTGGDAEIINETVTGFNPALGSAPNEINNTGRIINWYSTPFTLEVVSVTGTDTQPLQVSYINGNGDLVESIVTLTGTTPVAIADVQVFLFARNAGGFEFEVGGELQTTPDGGLIDGPVYFYKQGATPNADGDTFGMINKTLDLGDGVKANYFGQRTYGTHQSVPMGYSGYVKVIQPWVGKNDEAKISIQVKPRGTGNWSTEVPLSGIETVAAGNSNWRYLPEGFDVRVLGNESSGGTGSVMLQYQILLIKNGK